MNTQGGIEQKLETGIPNVLHLQVINESDRHNVPSGSESHFKVIVVSDAFERMSLLARHRMINRILADELSGGVHALAIHVYTRKEWGEKMGGAPLSPPCLGGGRAQSN